MDLLLKRSKTRQPQEMYLHFFSFSQFEAGVERAWEELNSSSQHSADHRPQMPVENSVSMLDGIDQQSLRASEEGELE